MNQPNQPIELNQIRGLYAIFDWPYPHPVGERVEAVVEALIEGGAQVVQLRAKQADSALRRQLLSRMAPICASAGVPLILNDDLGLALAMATSLEGFSGVHLGQGDVGILARPEHRGARARLREAGLMLGLSTHNLDQIVAARGSVDPDYLGFGPVFPTQSKLDADPSVGLEGLAQACVCTPLPVVAIGGATVERGPAIAASGAAAMAAIGSLCADSTAGIRASARALSVAFADGS